MASSILLLSAALVDTLAGARTLGEVFGWCGLGCLRVCVFCGIHYTAVNKKPKDDGWDLAS